MDGYAGRARGSGGSGARGQSRGKSRPEHDPTDEADHAKFRGEAAI